MWKYPSNTWYIFRGAWFRKASNSCSDLYGHVRSLNWYHSIGHIRFPISLPFYPCVYLMPFFRYYHLLARPAGMSMPPAGLCFTDDFFLFWLSTTGARISTRIDEKVLWLKFWWPSVKGRCHGNQFCGVKRRQVGMKRLYCLRWHYTTVRKIVKLYHIETLDVPSTPYKNFVNYSAVNYWDVMARL